MKNKDMLVWGSDVCDVGIVLEYSSKKIKIQYDNGNIKTYKLHDAVLKGVLRPL